MEGPVEDTSTKGINISYGLYKREETRGDSGFTASRVSYCNIKRVSWMGERSREGLILRDEGKKLSIGDRIRKHRSLRAHALLANLK